MTTATTHDRPVRAVKIGRVYERLEKMAENCVDLTDVKGSDITFNPNGTLQVKDQRFSFTDWSFAQFCSKLKLPTDFMRRSPNGDGPASRKKIIDYWKERHIDDRRFLIRTKRHPDKDEESGAEGRVRAFLTDRYSVFDNLDVVRQLHPLMKANDMMIQLGNVTEQSFHMRLLYGETINVGTEKKPDVHQMGLHFANSEVGARNLTGDLMVFRQICTNGMIALLEREHLFYQRHINVERHEVKNGMTAALEMAQIKKMELLDRLQDARAAELENARAEITRFLKLNRGTDEFVTKVHEAWDQEPVNNRFGVVQAITRAAQGLPIDQRVEMEEVAGRYLIAA